jgi:hypothetical protein
MAVSKRAVFRSTPRSTDGEVLAAHESLARTMAARQAEEERNRLWALGLAEKYPESFDIVEDPPAPGTRIVAVDVRDYDDVRTSVEGRQALVLRREFYCPCGNVWEVLADSPHRPEAPPLPSVACCIPGRTDGCGQEREVTRLYAVAVVYGIEAPSAADAMEGPVSRLADDERFLFTSGAFHLPPRERDDCDFDISSLVSHGRELRRAEEWEGE